MRIDLGRAARLLRAGGLAEALRRRFAPAAAPGSGGGRFLSAVFANAAGRRRYKLFVPAGYRGQKVPLIVMLHGCTQSPDDFAAGTRMNDAAEGACWLVVYPAQTARANLRKCWNWFRPGDVGRDSGEDSLIAGITRAVMAEYAVDPGAVFVAGLSAGGAMAAALGQAYPELYAAVGVHSGLAWGAASDVGSAFAAMQGGAAGVAGRAVPAIVLHGDADLTVSVRNADFVLAQALPLGARASVEDAGRFVRSVFRDSAGGVAGESFIVRGGGHAWFGGSPAGSFTDPGGPDATAEMLRFFLGHRRAG